MRGWALLVLDMQVAHVTDPRMWDGVGLLARVKDLVGACHRQGVPVIFVQHDAGPWGSVSRGRPGWEIHPELTLASRDTVIHKTASDAFYHTHLKNELEMRRIQDIVVVGCETERGVDTTCRRAASEGFNVHLVKDAHSTTAHGALEAPAVIEHHNRILESLVQPDHPIRLVATEEILAEL